MKTINLLLLTFSVFISSMGLAQTEIRGKDIAIVIDHKGFLHDKAQGSSGGFIVGFENQMNANIEIYDENMDVIQSYPIKIDTNSVGVTVIGTLENYNGRITLWNVKTKKVSDVLGDYYGIELAVALFGGAKGVLTVNGKGVVLGDLSGKMAALGVDLSAVRIRISKDTRFTQAADPSWDQKVQY